ncbi:MAG: DUF971 domain-containing protein [Acidobacteria bacterium]|jgi:DUF971 family protein|nr:MAG: DUF971 domain-containing protein [Acidobacteriota bacterium]GIU82438.1 MAG: hypothetical protein KatS3mg006_1502 [Pyrinomonadaceae bacterium]
MRIEPRQILQDSETKITIVWSDESKSEFDALQLRRACPCAKCVDEWTGEKILKDEQIDQKLKIEDIKLVGRYALNILFSDGHETGIYSFKYLYELSKESED